MRALGCNGLLTTTIRLQQPSGYNNHPATMFDAGSVHSSNKKGDAMRLAHHAALLSFLLGATIAVCNSGQGVQAPTLTRFVAPNYPSGTGATVSQKVTAIVIVNADGTVRDVTIKDSVGTPFEQAVTKALRKWVFTAAMKSGKVVACQISIPFSFESQSGETTVDLGHYTGE
jgi:TonB family protein